MKIVNQLSEAEVIFGRKINSPDSFFCFSKARITQLQYSKAHLTYLTQLIFGYSKARIPPLNIPKPAVAPNQIQAFSGICLVTL